MSGVIGDALIAILFLTGAVAGWPSADGLVFALLVEGGFLMMQATLVDIATRLRKRPPVWAVIAIAAGVLLFYGDALSVLREAWQRGMIVFAPLVLSLVRRARVLWLMPQRSRVQKIAARALIANRITTALVLLAIFAAAAVLTIVVEEVAIDDGWLILGTGAAYFGIAAFDAWRVRRPKFAEKPAVLFRFDPIGIDYLWPL